ncbi:hypothetical protein GEMRC1_012840 [Eukaryota sp. GEM-RC1]
MDLSELQQLTQELDDLNNSLNRHIDSQDSSFLNDFPPSPHISPVLYEDSPPAMTSVCLKDLIAEASASNSDYSLIDKKINALRSRISSPSNPHSNFTVTPTFSYSPMQQHSRPLHQSFTTAMTLDNPPRTPKPPLRPSSVPPNTKANTLSSSSPMPSPRFYKPKVRRIASTPKKFTSKGWIY